LFLPLSAGTMAPPIFVLHAGATTRDFTRRA
jgi:hypothetical protein